MMMMMNKYRSQISYVFQTLNNVSVTI